MAEQTRIGEYDGDTVGQAQAPNNPVTDAGPVLFRLSNDPFVNYAIASIATHLGDSVVVSPDTVAVAPDCDLNTVLSRLRGVLDDGLTATHRRTTLAHSVNATLDERVAPEDDARRIRSPTQPFPEDAEGSVTLYDDDRLSADDVERHDLASEFVDPDAVDDESLFAQSPSYVGTNRSDQFPKQRGRFDDAYEAFAQTLRGAVNSDEKFCMCCGSDSFPAYNNPVTGDKLGYNQSFAILTSTGGQVRPLGTGSRTSRHRGRCVACLVAGFYFAVMPKIVRRTGTNENDARIFVPTGDFERLQSITGDLYLNEVLDDLDSPVGANDANSRRRSLGELRTNSVGMQALDIYQRIVRHVFAEYGPDLFGTELDYRPTEFVSFVSELGRTRDISGLTRISPTAPIYELLQKQQRNDQAAEYWPVDDVLQWFAETGIRGGDDLTQANDTLAEGIIECDLERIRRGVVAISRRVEQANGENTPGYARPHPGDLHHFFSLIMQQSASAYDQIDSTDIESIQRVASAVGRVFSAGDDVSVLIGLQNASTQDEFLRAFEKAGMQAQKKSTDQPPQKFDAARDDDVAAVLDLITQADTFTPVKRMFVIHASLAAQYENAVGGSGGDEE